jgi:hypothetical protein
MMNPVRPSARPGSVGRRSLLTGAVAGGAGIAAIASVLPWDATPASASVGQGVTDWQNVVSGYGADPTGRADSTAAIQDAVNALPSGGGVVYFPAGSYTISSAIIAVSGASLVGAGSGATVITQSSASENGISATDASLVTIRDLTVQGPGSGSGSGISFGLSQNPCTPYLYLENVRVMSFGSNGIALSNPIVSVLSKVISQTNGGHGFSIHGIPSGAAGTSCSLQSCYANTNTGHGYDLDTMVYTFLGGCAADKNGYGYYLTSCQAVQLSGCGAEGTVTDSFVLTGGYGNTLASCWIYDNAHYGVHLTGSERCATLIGPVENTPASGAQAFIITDTGTTATMLNCSNITANELSGDTTVLNDGGGDLTAAGSLTVGGTASLGITRANGNLTAAGGWAKQGMSVKTAAYTLTTSDTVILASASSGAFKLTLPSSANVFGQQYTIKKIDSTTNAITVAPVSSQKIDGAASRTLSAEYDYLTIIADGANWQIIA